MRETNRARQAFNDYFEMGPNRSLRKLQRIYINPATKSPPTKHLRSLAIWSKEHKWQDRIAQREAEITAARLQDIIENAPKTGYAIWQNRVHGLDKLAQFIDPLVAIKGLFSPTLVREYRALLADIAAEMGERTKQIELGGRVELWRQEAEQAGISASVLFERMVAEIMAELQKQNASNSD